MKLFNRESIKKACAYIYLVVAYVYIILNFSYEVQITNKPLGFFFLTFYTLGCYYTFVIIDNFIIEKVISKKH